MVGEIHHPFLRVEILPTGPSQQGQKRQSAEAANYSCLREKLRVIVVAVIYDKSVISGFIARIHLLQRAQTSSGNGVIEKNPPGPVQHGNPAALTHFQGFVACKPLEGAAYAEPGH